MWQSLLWIALAGAAGTLARYGLSSTVGRIAGGEYPWGTLVVNSLGCFLFGLFWSLSSERLLISTETKLVVLTGFMGAFTTFSTFAFEGAAMMKDSQWWFAAAHVLGHNVLGVACVLLGIAASRCCP